MLTPDKLEYAVIIKFFDKMEYAQKFIAGELFASKLQRFKDIESVGRNDVNEGKVEIPNADNQFRVFITDVNKLPTSNDEIKGVMKMSFNANEYADTPIWCASLLYEGHGLHREGDKLIFADSFKAMAKEFGKYAVTMYYTRFIKIMSKAFDKNVMIQEVEYVDNDIKISNLSKYMENQMEIIFTKDKHYSYQYEVRMLFCENIDTISKVYNIGFPLSIEKKDYFLFDAEKVLEDGINITTNPSLSSIER